MGKRGWNRQAAWDLQMRAERYIKERQPSDYLISGRAKRELEQIRKAIGRSYELEDPDAHEQGVARFVKLSLREYAQFDAHPDEQEAGVSASTASR